METFQIIYKGVNVPVRVDHSFHEVTREPVFFIDLPGKTLYIEMSEEGFWTECEGETSIEIQELGQLIEEHDY